MDEVSGGVDQPARCVMIAVIADQLKLFRHQLGKHVVFVGSEAVLQPYEATVEQLLERMALDWAGDLVVALPPDQRPKAALAAFADAHPNHADRCAQLGERLKDLRPGEGHIQLARLIKEGYVPLLFTMSPDDSLERALAAQKMVAGEDYHCVVAGVDSPKDIATAIRQSTRVVVVKCGGDLHARLLPLTPPELAANLAPIADLVAEFFKRTAFFVAYADRDAPFLALVPRDGERIFWINRHIPVDDPKAVDDMRLVSPDAEQFHKLQPEVVALMAARHSSRNLLGREAGRFSEFFGRVHERLRRRTTRRSLAGRPELSVLRGGPYKFLEAYDVHDAETFFAREQEVEQLYTLVRENRLATLFGRMATGKTSLVRAGLIPRLKKANRDEADGRREAPWLPVYVRCGADVLRDLRHALAEQVEEFGYRCGSIIEARTLREVAVRCRELTKHRPVFVADNAQELFLKLSQTARDELTGQVADLIDDPDGDARLLLVIREDYLGELYELSNVLPGVMSCLMRLHKFTRAQAEDAIVKPASSFGIQFERDLVAQIIEDIDREGVLPAHLQIVCHRLLEEAGPGRTHVGSMLYRRLGGARKILDEYVEHAVSQLPVTDRRLAWNVLRALAGVSETLAAVSLNELAEQVRGSRVAFDRVLARLVDLRLLRLYDRGSVRYVELIHDLLAEDIRKTLASRQPATAQSVHDILARGLDNFRLTGQLLERGEMYAVNDERADLTLTAQELELVIRSSLEHDIEADYWLGRLGELRDGAFRVLADALGSDNPRIRAQALKHAKEHLGQPLIEPLAKLADSDAPERKRAEELLRSMERELVAALSSEDSDLRGWAATALSRVNGKRHLKDLAGALADDHPSVTERVADALVEIDAVRSARVLLDALRGRSGQWAAAEAVGRLAQAPAVTSMLHKAMAREPASPYLAYAYGVAQTRQRRYEEALETLGRAKALAERQGIEAGPVEAALARVQSALARAKRGEDRWAMAGGSPYHVGYVPDALPPPLREFWTANLEGEIVGSVVVGQGLAFVGLRRGLAVCLDTASGALRWKRRLNDQIEAAPALLDDRLLVITANGSVVALDFSGNQVAAGRAGPGARAPLTVTDDMVLAGDRAGVLTALMAQDLTPRWRYHFGAEVTGPASCRHGLVYAGSWDATVVALEADSGEVVWRWLGDGPVAGAVAAGEEMLAWATDTGLVVAAEPSTGEVIWQAQLPSGARAGVALSAELLVVGCLDGLARCLSVHDGSSVWEFPTDDQILAQPLIVGDIVYLASRDGRLYALDLHTGQLRWSYTTSYGIYASPAVVEGVMMAVLRQRQVVAFVPEEETAR